MRNRTVRSVLMCGMLTAIFAAQASAQKFYEASDAEYVTTSKNPAVIRYVICLEDAVGSTPRNVSIPDALAGAMKTCQRWAQRLPNTAGEPTADDIKQSILECGFRPGSASPDADCGDTNAKSAGGSPQPGAPAANSDQAVLTPTVIEVGKWAEGIAFDGTWLWVAESGQRTLARIDMASGKVAERVKVGRLPTSMVSTGDGNVFAMVATDKFIWSQNGKGRRTTLARLGECPDSMIEGGQDLWALTQPDCSSDQSRLVRIDPSNGRREQTENLGQWAQAMTAHGDQIWVGHARGPALSEVDQNSLDATSVKIDGASIWSMTANSRNVFAAGRVNESNNDGLVVMLDPANRTEVSRVSLSQRVAQILSDEDHVVAIGGQGAIWVLSAKDLTLLRTITLSTGAFDPRAAIFNEDSILISSSKYRGDNGAVFVVGNWRPDGQQASAPDPVAPAPGQRIAPSFDCTAANSAAELVICANNQLASLDKALGIEYNMAVSNITSPAVGGTVADVLAFKKEQRAWLSKRDACRGDEDCLFAAYQGRLRILEKINKPE